jgi:hypothetical protein
MRDQSPAVALTRRQAVSLSALSAPDRRRRAAPSGRTPSRSHAAARETHLIQAIRDAARRRKLEAEALAEDKPARKRAHRSMIALQAAANHVEQLPDEDPDLAWLQHQHAHHGRLILSQGALELRQRDPDPHPPAPPHRSANHAPSNATTRRLATVG